MSASPVSEETIKKTAELAHLELTPEEVKLYSKQLGAVLDYVSLLARVDTKGIEPLVAATDMTPTMRDDEVRKVFSDDEATANAPEKLGNLFKVPPVL